MVAQCRHEVRMCVLAYKAVAMVPERNLLENVSAEEYSLNLRVRI